MLLCAGESVAKYIREPSPFNTQIVSLGVDTYLKMLLADNFVHTDLHPGNIMVRIRGVSLEKTRKKEKRKAKKKEKRSKEKKSKDKKRKTKNGKEKTTPFSIDAM